MASYLLNCFSQISFTLGLYLLSFLFFPGYYSGIHERIVDDNLTIPVACIGFMCVFCPISLLFITTRKDYQH
jgi:hypothetical protein